MAQFFVDLNIKKRERLKLHATIGQLEEELAQWRPQISEPSTSSFPVPFTADSPCSTAFQDNCTVDIIQISKPTLKNTLKRTSSSTSKFRLPEQPRAPPSNQTTSGSSLDLETRVKQLEEEIIKARNSLETILSIYRSQFPFLYDRFREALESGDTDNILWKLTSLRLVFDTAEFSARLDYAAKDPSTHYHSPVYLTHPHGQNSFVQFCPYGLDFATGNHASIMLPYSPATTMGY